VGVGKSKDNMMRRGGDTLMIKMPVATVERF